MTWERLRGGWVIAPEILGLDETADWPLHIPDAAAPAPVPGIIQQVLPDHHGLAWYWRDWVVPKVRADERVLLTFEAIDYAATVWLNGVRIGGHEGGETPFTLDVTDAAQPGSPNLVTVRILNPTNERIDGMVLEETPHANKSAADFRPGSAFNFGGIIGDVSARVVPSIFLEELVVAADWRSGAISASLQVRSHRRSPEEVTVRLTVREDRTGVPVTNTQVACIAEPGAVEVRATLEVPDFQSWDIDDPFLYSVEARLSVQQAETDSASAKTGFRLFEVQDGYFRLNGRRIYLRSTHTGNHYPLGQKVPPVAGMLRQDLVHAKASGFNTIRWIAGLAHPAQLAFCDEIGLLVYEEPAAAWLLKHSPEMEARFDRSVREMILRDRNHPSVVIWGLLNETRDGPVFRHAAAALPLVRTLDRTRVVILGSGRWDADLTIGSISNPESEQWEYEWGAESSDAADGNGQIDGPDGHAYVQGAGDIHLYPENPETPEAWRLLRTMGSGQHPVLLSEYGAGSLFDAITETADSAAHVGCVVPPDLAYARSMATRYTSDWLAFGMDSVYANPEDAVRESQLHQARRRSAIFTAIRSNPQIAGYNLTGMLDHALTGEGSWTYWRRWKPGSLDALADGWAPLRWCLTVEPPVAYADQGITIDLRLAHEEPLPDGEYPLSLAIVGPSGQRHEYPGLVRSSGPGRDALAEPVLEVSLDGPHRPGLYRLSASMGDRLAPAAGRAEFQVLAGPGRQLETLRAIAVGLTETEQEWLENAGVEFVADDEGSLVVVGHPDQVRDADGVDRMATEALPTLVLCPWEYLPAGGDEGPLPLGVRVSCRRLYDWLYHKDCYSKRHPIFENLPGPGLMGWDVFGSVWPRYILHGEPPEDIAAAAFAVGYPCLGGYDAGPIVATYRRDGAAVVVSCLDLLSQLGSTPVADHLIVNLVRHAATLSPENHSV